MKSATWPVGLLLVIVGINGCGVAPAQDPKIFRQDFGWHDPELVTQLQSQQVNESSGLGVSREPGIFFTHNDSGDTPRFFKFNSSGNLLATFTLTGAQAVDWEAMTSVTLGGIDYLYFGDIGDNLQVRASIKVYRVREPAGSGGSIADFDTYTLTYPDGAHNAETLMVHPRTGDITIVTKTSSGPSKVFKATAPPTSGSYALTAIGQITFPSNPGPGRLATAGDIASDGFRVVVRTYLAAYEFRAPKRFDDWVKGAPEQIHVATEVQGEAIAYSRDAMSLFTTSEGTPMPLSVIRRRRN